MCKDVRGETFTSTPLRREEWKKGVLGEGRVNSLNRLHWKKLLTG